MCVCIYIHMYATQHTLPRCGERWGLNVMVSIVDGFEWGSSCPRLHRDGSYDRVARRCRHSDRATRETQLQCV